MRKALAVAAALSLACAVTRSAQAPLSIPISVSSNNKRSVDVYLLCGDAHAQWLGVVHSKQVGAFEVPSSRSRCAQGLNFFLVPRNLKHGFWVGPLQLRSYSAVHLTIEKYAGLSVAEVDNDLR